MSLLVHRDWTAGVGRQESGGGDRPRRNHDQDQTVKLGQTLANLHLDGIGDGGDFGVFAPD